MKKLLVFTLLVISLPAISFCQKETNDCFRPDVFMDIHGILWNNYKIFKGSKSELLSLYKKIQVKQPKSPDSLNLIAVQLNPNYSVKVKPNGHFLQDEDGNYMIEGLVTVNTFHKLKKGKKKGAWKIDPHKHHKEDVIVNIPTKKPEQEAIAKKII